MFQFIPVNDGNHIAVRVSGKLTREDYQQFVPKLELLLVANEKISLLIELDDFQGITLDAIKEELKLMRYDDDIIKVAVVGDKQWQQWMTLLAQPFVSSQIKYFSQQHLAQAWDWLREKQHSDQELADLPVKPYQKIMAGIDFSPFSKHAAKRAVGIAQQFDAELQLVYIVNESALYDFYSDTADPGVTMTKYTIQAMELTNKTMDLLIDKAEHRMSVLCEDLGLKQEQGVVLCGKPTTTLVSYAEAQAIDLIIMGTRGRSMATLLGSSTRYVQSRARCDVLSVALVE